MDLIVPIAVAAVSIGLMYAFCIRPMRKGHCAMTPGAAEQHCSEAGEQAEIASLRREAARLHAQLAAPPSPTGPAAGHSQASGHPAATGNHQ